MTDEQLAAELKSSAGKKPVHRPVGELLGRHWEAVHSYARLCADGAHPAGMLTTAAFTRLFEESGRGSGPTAAWRPELLVTVRQLAGEWDTDHRRALLHPALRSGPGEEESAAARLLPPRNRRLMSLAFRRMAEPDRCLLWHVEVEREEVAVPAALLGIDLADAAVRLERVRERLREVCLDVHRESAPDEECRHYSGLLDVSLRRADRALDPDLRLHLDGCPHCRDAAGQLEGFRDRLSLLLAEGVLGWGAQEYLDTKDARSIGAGEPAEPEPLGAEPSAGDAGPGSPEGSKEASPSRRRTVLAVAAVGVFVLVPLALWSGVRSEGPAVVGAPAPSGKSAPGPSTSAGASPKHGAVPMAGFQGRLRNEGNGLCVGLDRDKAVVGAEAVLVPCAAATTQRWTYATEGPLRSAAAPDLCLDSRLGYAVQLVACAERSGPGAETDRYDVTDRGVIVPRGNRQLALTPASPERDAGLVLRNRTEDPAQRWIADTADTADAPKAADGPAASPPGTEPPRAAGSASPPVPGPTGTGSETGPPSARPGERGAPDDRSDLGDGDGTDGEDDWYDARDGGR
ncbi:RICIN domain-containing protein [Streptomyces nodosus]|uniref:RICIN domain-containing protein n=1 Tax=Streptomyces nodosus TaxID=40318 RepID=UPI00380238BA